MLYLSYGVYRSSFVFDNIFHLIKRHTQNTRKCTQLHQKKDVIRTPVEVEYNNL